MSLFGLPGLHNVIGSLNLLRSDVEAALVRNQVYGFLRGAGARK